MTTPTRESVFGALFDRVKTLVPSGAYAGANFVASGAPSAGQLKTASRALRHWDDVQAEEMPYLAQVQKPEIYAQRRGLPEKKTWVRQPSAWELPKALPWVPLPVWAWLRVPVPA